ncbi:hypothetical protein [Bacillus sp. NPDC094106]|uniref:hypothetical protein n=1 Tax=Bacillus sp. NPDC094106 TaxID=3363949 RepID=UPI0038236B64
MEGIIVTYITQSNEEVDIAIPNDVKTIQIIESILHYEKIEENQSLLYEIRATRDKEEWLSVLQDETLRDQHVWDGYYIMLHKKGTLIPSLEFIKTQEIEERQVAVQETGKEDGYVWKVIE